MQVPESMSKLEKLGTARNRKVSARHATGRQTPDAASYIPKAAAHW